MLQLHTLQRIGKSYALPLAVTGLFVVVLAGLLIHRHVQLGGLPEELQSDSRPGASETRLISQDEAAEITTKSDNELPPDAAEASSTSGSGNGSNGASSGSGGSEGSSGGGNEADDFEAEILGMDHSVTETSYNREDLTCTVTHQIDAGIRTSRGPGKVNYRWERSNEQRTPLETLRAARGDNNYLISHTWQITSRVGGPPEDRWVRFLMRDPATEAQRQTFEHSCRPHI